MDAKSNKAIFNRLFDQTKDDPEEWGATAWNLRTAAEVLLDAYGETWSPDGEPVHQENEHLDSPACMLFGCAMENMIKGYLIKKDGSFEKARTANPLAWNKHKICDLAAATGLPLTPEQKLLLTSLEAFVVWAGRYPISLRRENYTIEKQYMCGDHITPSEIGHDEIKILEPFYKKLEEEVFENLRKNFGEVLTGVKSK